MDSLVVMNKWHRLCLISQVNLDLVKILLSCLQVSKLHDRKQISPYLYPLPGSPLPIPVHPLTLYLFIPYLTHPLPDPFLTRLLPASPLTCFALTWFDPYSPVTWFIPYLTHDSFLNLIHPLLDASFTWFDYRLLDASPHPMPHPTAPPYLEVESTNQREVFTLVLFVLLC